MMALACWVLIVDVFVPHANASADRTVSLEWNPNVDTVTQGYLLYSRDAAGHPLTRADVGMNTTAMVGGLTAGSIRIFQVTAYDSLGKESAPSNEVVYFVPDLENPAPVTSGTVANVGLAWTVSIQGDLNGDGKPDLAWRNLVTGSVGVWLMSGVNTISTAALWPATNSGDSDWVPVATGDFNADGKPDIIWRNSTSGRVIIWFMNGLARASTARIVRRAD